MLDLLVGFSILCQGGDVLPYTPEEEPPMAYFDVVPQQDVTGVFNMGAVAYHLEGIDRVEYTVTREGFVGDWNHDGITDGQDLGFLLERWGQGVGGRELSHLLGAWGQSISHKPQVITVTEQTLNPRTGELEYWFALDTRKNPDTKITVSAEAFGTMGPSVVLDRDIWDESFPLPQYSGVNLFSNNTSYWPTRELYISPDGDDKVGDGTRENPLKGIHAALRYGLQQPYAEIGGTTIYLLEGEHTIDAAGGWPLRSFRQSNGRFFTITPASGVASADCKIVASNSTSPDGGFMNGGLMRLKDVFVDTVQEKILNGGTNFGGGRWYDGCIIKGDEEGAFAGDPIFVTGKGGFQWWTDTLHSYSQEGTTGLIMRNCVIDGVSCDALELHFAQLLLSIELTNMNPLGVVDPSACHTDYMQYNGIDYIHQNVILRDIYANDSCLQQGVHACPGEGDGGAIHNSAWVNVVLSNTGGNGLPECDISSLIWRWCGPARNNLFKDCLLIQKQSNPADRHSTFSYNRNNPDGSRNEEGPWCLDDFGNHKFINIKIEDCYEDWDLTAPWFPAPTAGASWSFYGPDELMWNSNMNVDEIQENAFGPDDPWFCPITGVYFTQTN